MLFKKGILLFLVLLFFSGCEGKNTQQIITEDEMNKIYVKKGSYMKKRLKPEIIKTDKAILAITGVN
ncbi:MAG: hypothetical protein JXB88_06115, partial [Spirochaetales bacterium]|nr:hypothetical protein [Spirochaetales bacterium]